MSKPKANKARKVQNHTMPKQGPKPCAMCGKSPCRCARNKTTTAMMMMGD